MRIKEIKLYKFDELPEETQEKVLPRSRKRLAKKIAFAPGDGFAESYMTARILLAV